MITRRGALEMLRTIWGTPTGFNVESVHQLEKEAQPGEHPMHTAARIAQCPKLLKASPFDFLYVQECVAEIDAELNVEGVVDGR